ncbi:MAG: efflux transporter outer membrane subunit [Sphingomonas sp.]
MRRTAAIAALTLLAGCTSGTDYRRPEPEMPAAWTQANALPRPAASGWWTAYGDPVLTRLVEAALAGNPDIDQALARVEQAEAAAGLARAALLPTAELEGVLARVRQSTTEGLGQLTRYVPDLPRVQDRGRLAAGASWDLDFAGGLRRGREAARADLAAAAAGADAARLIVAAELTDAYLGYRGSQEQLALLERRRAILADRRGIMAARVRVGEAASQALDGLDAGLAAIDAVLPLQRAALTIARLRITVLTGRPAGTPLPELDAAAPVPLAGDPAAGLPADMLRRRPDLLAAEAQLHAAHARIGTALAEYWPKVSLSGLLGFDSNALGRFGSDASSVVQGAAGLRWRLFDFGRIDAEVAAARGGEKEMLAAYRGAVLRAGEQVESGFTDLAGARAGLDRRQAQRDALAQAYGRARASFRSGEISRDTLRGAELAMLDGEDALAAARVALARALLACHRALGG